MSIKVMHYSAVEHLYEERSAFKEWSSALHITATTSLRKGMYEHLSHGSQWLKSPILTFGQMLDGIGDGSWNWYSSKTQLKQFSIISRKLREMSADSDIRDPKIFNAMSKNKHVLLRTLRMFTEAEETSSSVANRLNDELSMEERLALEVWKELEGDQTFISYRKWITNFTKPGCTGHEFSEMVTDIICGIFTEDNEQERQMANLEPFEPGNDEGKQKELIALAVNRLLSQNKIVLHGFYFITPIQKQIIDALDKAGFEILHLINYQEGYPNVFEAVDVFLEKEEQGGFEPASKMPSYINKIAQKFLHACEGDFDISLDGMPGKYHGFTHMYQFKEYIENEASVEKEIHDFLISPRAREVRAQVEGMNSMKPLTLKDYPIGQFLVDMHSLNITTFDEERENFKDREELSVESLVSVFASGFIEAGDIPAYLLVGDLKKLEARLDRKSSFTEYIDEVEKIRSDKQLIEQALMPKGMEVTPDNELYIYENRLLSYFDVSIERLDAIIETLRSIRDLYDIIFTDDTIEVDSYVERLLGFLQEEVLVNIDREEEVEVAEQLLDKLLDMRDSDFEHFDRQDLIQGLRFFLSEELEDTENSLFGESLLGSKIVSLQDGDFLPFSDDQAVHLSFLDNKSLPLSQNLVTWPFNDDSMERLYDGSLLKLVQNRKKHDASITKYLLYLIMSNAASLKFSSVANVGQEKDLERSFYLDLLDILQSDTLDEGVENTATLRGGYVTKKLSFDRRKRTPLIDETRKVCGKRMVLSYLIQESPSFSSEFHQRFLFEKFIAQFNHLSKKSKIGLSKSEIREMVSDWFPQWDNTKRAILAKGGEEWNYHARPFVVDGVTIMDDLKSLALFGRLGENSEEFANPGPRCKYCPFQDSCKESEYSKDEY